ncbi:MAG: hypothetical protein K8T20_01945 [Planctomycetes bacterium]|nr:hypothetical protein [Planctomycetota bacterium]
MTFSDFDGCILDRESAIQGEASVCVERFFSTLSPEGLEEVRRFVDRWHRSPDRPARLAFEWFRLRHPSDARALLNEMDRRIASFSQKADETCEDGSG